MKPRVYRLQLSPGVNVNSRSIKRTVEADSPYGALIFGPSFYIHPTNSAPGAFSAPRVQPMQSGSSSSGNSQSRDRNSAGIRGRYQQVVPTLASATRKGGSRRHKANRPIPSTASTSTTEQNASTQKDLDPREHQNTQGKISQIDHDNLIESAMIMANGTLPAIGLFPSNLGTATTAGQMSLVEYPDELAEFQAHLSNQPRIFGPIDPNPKAVTSSTKDG